MQFAFRRQRYLPRRMAIMLYANRINFIDASTIASNN